MKTFSKIILILLLGAGISGCGNEPEPGGQEPEETAVLTASRAQVTLTPEQLELAGVRLGLPEERVLSNYVECAGVVEVPPGNLASVYSPVNGFVQQVRHLPGQYVRKGELLTTITHPDLVRLQRQFLESTSQLSALERDYERKKTLADAEAASQRALEQARSAYDLERARYRGLKAELDLIGIDTGKLEEAGEIQSTLAIVAPVSGYINIVAVNTGKLITPQELLYEIVDNRHVHLELQVYAKDLGKIHEGQAITATMPGGEQELRAEVHLIGKMIDPETITALVHGHFLKEPVEATPGTYMHAHIYLDEQTMTAVPAGAVVREGEDAFVFVEMGKGFDKVPVQLGRQDGDYVAIHGLSLDEGQRIVLEGAYYINGSMEEE